MPACLFRGPVGNSTSPLPHTHHYFPARKTFNSSTEVSFCNVHPLFLPPPPALTIFHPLGWTICPHRQANATVETTTLSKTHRFWGHLRKEDGNWGEGGGNLEGVRQPSILITMPAPSGGGKSPGWALWISFLCASQRERIPFRLPLTCEIPK